LCLVTAGALIAAVKAYTSDIAPRLVQESCKHDSDDAKIVHRKAGEVYIFPAKDGRLSSRVNDTPPAFDQRNYKSSKSDFINVGRWTMLQLYAILDVAVIAKGPWVDARVREMLGALTNVPPIRYTVHSRRPGQRLRVRVPLGFLMTPDQRSEQFSYVLVHLHRQLIDDVRVAWTGEADHESDRFRYHVGDPLTFRDPVRTTEIGTAFQ
jgi:hypothetical protein